MRVVTEDDDEDPLSQFDVDIDTEKVDDDIVELIEEHVDDPDHGFFGPDTMMWEVNKENATLLTGITAILLQVGHPMIAAAGVHHSNFDDGLSARFKNTFDIVDTIIFGDVESAVRASMTVRRLHDRVKGELPENVGRFDEGDTYDANSNDLLLWVHATLIDQMLEAYDIYVGDLTDEEREQYYQESKLFGQLFSIPRDYYPETLDDFYDYYEETIENDIALGETADDVLERFFGELGYLTPFIKTLGAATMPEGARDEFEEYGVKMTQPRIAFFDLYTFFNRSVPNWLVADRLRYRSKYRYFDRSELLR